MPRVSVIIPVYNGERTLDKMATSLIEQDYPKIEIIAVNDGSADGSLSILKNYNFIKIINQTNSGVSASRNHGILEAKGDLIAFIDQDDVWCKDKISRQVQIIESTNVDYVFNNFYRFDHDTNRQYKQTNSEINPFIYSYKCSLDNDIRIFRKSIVFDFLLRGYPIYPSTMMVRRDLLKDAGNWNPKFPRCQDFDFSLRCSRFTEFAYTDTPLTGIGRHSSNVSESYIDQLVEDIDVCLHHCKSGFFTPKEIKRINYWVGKRMAGLGWNLANTNKIKQSRNYYLKALSYRSSFIDALLHIPFTFFPLSCLWRTSK